MGSDAFISRAKQIVLSNLLNPQFGVVGLASELGISRSELYKRIKASEKKSASQFIREIRLEKASELLSTSKYSISEIAYMVGFNSPTYFSTCFKEHYGYSPSTAENNDKNSLSGDRSKHRKWAFSLVIVAMSLMFLGWMLSGKEDNKIEQEKLLAVLKFDYLGSDVGQSHLGEVLADEIINSLSNLSTLKVITASSSFQVDKDEMCTKIGKRLGVDYLVDGSVRNHDDQLKATVKLIDAETGIQLWAQSYEAEIESFFEMQGEISKKVADELRSFIPQGDRFTLPQRRSTNLEAMELYFDAVKKSEVRYEDSITQAIRWLERAIELDPYFAEAHAELSFLYGQWHYYGSLNREERDKMMGKYLGRALELNSESPEVLLAKADYDYKNGNLLNDSSAIISGFRKVLEANPNNHRSSYRLYQVLRSIGKYHTAHTYLDNALRLDPLNSLYNNVYARDLFWKWNEREKAFGIIENEGSKENPSRGAIYFRALMLADQLGGDYLLAFQVIQDALEQQPYTFGFLYWGRLLALDLDLVPIARKYAQLNQVKYPDNPIYTYQPAFQVCITEKRYEDALDLTRIWLEDKTLDKKVGYTNLAKVYYLQGEIQKSKEILLQHFSERYQHIESGRLTIASIQPSDIAIIKGYIEVLRKEGAHKKADFFADFMCSYYKAHSPRIMLGKKFYPMDCDYVQNDVEGFLYKLNEAFFDSGYRLALFSNLKASRYAAFEENTEYQELLKKIETETHRMRAEVIAYLKEQDAWDPSWDDAIQ